MGGKGVERLKAHSSLRKYIEYAVDQMSASEDFAPMKASVRENLEAISKQITNNKLYMKYNSLAKQSFQDKKKAEQILQPSKAINIEFIISKWNGSLEKEETDRDYSFIYENAIQNNYISISNFTRYAIYVRLALLLRLHVYNSLLHSIKRK